MLPEGASPILKVDAEEAREARAAARAEPRRGGRLLGAVFAFAAIVGFGSLIAFYFVQNRDGHLDPASIPIVRADGRPMKVRPENPGGIEVPFQNTEIYDRVAQQAAGAGTGAARSAQGGERLMPGPEAPLPRPQPPPAPTPAIPAAPEIVVPPDAVVVAPPRVASVPPANLSAQAAPTPQPAPASPPQVAAAPRQTPPTATPQAVPSVAAPSPSTGGARIQLASVRDTAAAQREWARVSRQYADLLGQLTPQYIPADLGDRGVFIRVQAGPFASPEAAKTVCDALRARGAGCNVVR
jgi:hypothetical protein